MASHVWDYIVYYAWAFCSCPFLRFWAMRRPTVCETGEGKEPTHSVFKSIKANVGLIYLILGFCRKHNE